MRPEAGSVLGIDVGWSLRSASSAVCRLDWDGSSIRWVVRHFTGQPEIRAQIIAEVADSSHQLLVAALDGPLRGDLAVIDTYRVAERLLSRPPMASRISQPGSSRSPLGRLLNHHSNEFARLLVGTGRVAAATHAHAIHDVAVVEAFPTSFLGLMHPDPEKGLRHGRSDRYFMALCENGTLERLLLHHLPGRRLEQAINATTDHDDRAALICAITALGVACHDYLALGGQDGWIILPPASFIAEWARPLVASWNQGVESGLSL